MPVYYPISAYDKIAIEAPYHALTNAGHISYIEMDGDPTENLGAFERVIRCMKEKGIGYGFQQPARFKGMKVKKLLDIAAGKKLPMLACNEYLAKVGLCSASYLTREVDKNLPNPVRVFDVPSPQTSILKASVYCDDAVMDMAYILTRELDDDFVFAPSGRKWIDVMQRGVSKATGIQQVLDAHGIQASEMMAFGDSMNDYEILRMAGTSVAMGNARSAIKQIATKVIGTNVDRSVQRELHALLEGAR